MKQAIKKAASKFKQWFNDFFTLEGADCYNFPDNR